MKLVLVILALAVMVMAFPVGAKADLISDLSGKISLDACYLQTLNGDGDQTALTASWRIVDKAVYGLDLDVLIAPDFQGSTNWGVGLSGNIISGPVGLKLGVGYFDADPVVYVAFPIVKF